MLAHHFAEADPYRAAMHNEGIMNGSSAMVLATGNDTRAAEAGAHACAARDGRYTSPSRWEFTREGHLAGSLELPMAVGLVGGATKVHPMARVALKTLRVCSAEQVARTITAVGLAQNFSALRARATTNIQKGDMALHAHTIAMMAGAFGDEVDAVAKRLLAGGTVRQDLAEQLLAQRRAERSGSAQVPGH